MQSAIQISPQLLHDLRLAVADLKKINPWDGLIRLISLSGITTGLAILAWRSDSIFWFVVGAIATSITYAFGLICNHDATHHSLTGWAWFDTIVPRLISWPMLWPVGTYNQLHQLHHGWNGIDLRDPERVQWTATEYQIAPAWQRWYVRHQWSIDIFIFGGIGLIARVLLRGLKLKNTAPQLYQQMIIDVVGIALVQSAIISFVYSQAMSGWKYLLFWLLLERGIGIIIQAREHLEHYGLWQNAGNHQLTQLYACRNLKTPRWVTWLMGGLPYHAVHHAFPQIASAQLPEAFQRIQAVLQRHHLPLMVLDAGYMAASLDLSKHPSLIETEDKVVVMP